MAKKKKGSLESERLFRMVQTIPCIWGHSGVPRTRLSNSYGLRSVESDGIRPPDLGSKKCNLIIQILAINEVDHKYLATRNATCCVLLYFS